ncbi:MAG: HEAT repeat domain-containing protein, partial [Lachnospiraceae bacterium]|nr:HEAT repeat domain-containing protein [Lachnospiraceae bacterium]
FKYACDDEPKVRLSFIWASENIATNTPDIYKDHMNVFEKLLHDENDKVRMEAPEIFRVLGKRRPEFVIPFIDDLKQLAENDTNRVVRIHSLGAIKATNK